MLLCLTLLGSWIKPLEEFSHHGFLFNKSCLLFLCFVKSIGDTPCDLNTNAASFFKKVITKITFCSVLLVHHKHRATVQVGKHWGKCGSIHWKLGILHSDSEPYNDASCCQGFNLHFQLPRFVQGRNVG